jgi:hypothetical protein
LYLRGNELGDGSTTIEKAGILPDDTIHVRNAAEDDDPLAIIDGEDDLAVRKGDSTRDGFGGTLLSGAPPANCLSSNGNGEERMSPATEQGLKGNSPMEGLCA